MVSVLVNLSSTFLAMKMQRRIVRLHRNRSGGATHYAYFGTRQFVRVFTPADYLSDHAKAGFRRRWSLRKLSRLRQRIRLQLGGNANGERGEGERNGSAIGEPACAESARARFIASLASRELIDRVIRPPSRATTELGLFCLSR